MRQILSVVMALLIAVPTVPVSAQAVDEDVKKGIAQVEDGDYDGAILTLDNASRRLLPDKTKGNDLAQAYLYLGIAYIGKGREAAAKAKFREAISQIKDLSLSADKFSPKVVDLFEAAKAEAARESAAKPAAASGAAPAPTPEKKKGGSGKTILIVGGVAAAGAIAAVAAGGGGSSGGTANTPTTPTNQSLSFTGTLPNSGGSYECKQVVATKAGTLEARLSWTNGQLALGILCQEHEPPYTGCAGTSNRTSNTTAVLTAPVTQKTYDICPFNNGTVVDNYSLVITFP